MKLVKMQFLQKATEAANFKLQKEERGKKYLAGEIDKFAFHQRCGGKSVAT